MIIETSNSVQPPGCSVRARGVFTQYREELQWLATFLTGDNTIGQACVIDACALSDSENLPFQEWLLEWARLATIRSAAEMQKQKIAQLCAGPPHKPCIHGGHSGLTAASIEFVAEQSGLLLRKLDVLCRFALVLCGLEKRPVTEAALLLDVDSLSIENAYCAALRWLGRIGCHQFQSVNEVAAAACD